MREPPSEATEFGLGNRKGGVDGKDRRSFFALVNFSSLKGAYSFSRRDSS
jgi:hypothetical protein